MLFNGGISTATHLIGEPNQLQLSAHDLMNVLAVSPSVFNNVNTKL